MECVGLLYIKTLALRTPGRTNFAQRASPKEQRLAAVGLSETLSPAAEDDSLERT